jgi:AcrR family transcriptional regulator
MSSLTTPEAPVAPRRKLPKQILNETKMVNAAIDLLRDRSVDEVTSRLIADYSGTTVSYLTRYWGGRDEFLVDVAIELGRRINVLVRAEQLQIDLDNVADGLERFLAMADVQVWFKLHRYLAGRDQLRALEPDRPSALLVSFQEGVADLFGLDAEESMSWAVLLLTLLMGNQAFGPLLGSTEAQFRSALDHLADALKLRSAVVAAGRPETEPVADERRTKAAGRRGSDRFRTP